MFYMMEDTNIAWSQSCQGNDPDSENLKKIRKWVYDTFGPPPDPDELPEVSLSPQSRVKMTRDAFHALLGIIDRLIRCPYCDDYVQVPGDCIEPPVPCEMCEDTGRIDPRAAAAMWKRLYDDTRQKLAARDRIGTESRPGESK